MLLPAVGRASLRGRMCEGSMARPRGVGGRQESLESVPKVTRAVWRRGAEFEGKRKEEVQGRQCT